MIMIDPSTPNWAQFVRRSPGRDRGSVTGPSSDPDTFNAPDTAVVNTFDVSGSAGQISLSTTSALDDAFVRLRGSDGRRTQAGLNVANVDAAE
jgi:hypothetical protein